MSDERPEALLRSALEKIVYFEARSKQLENDITGARAEADRLRDELAHAAQREIELRRKVASLEVESARAHRERDEVARSNEALRHERVSLLDQIIEASRIHAAGGPDDDEAAFDLASFIAQLRSEVLTAGAYSAAVPLRAVAAPAPELVAAPQVKQVAIQQTRVERIAVEHQAVAAEAAVVAVAARASPLPTPTQSAVAAHAERLHAAGRLQVSAEEMARLSGGATFPGRTEETLFGFSVRELSAPDPSARARAADRLRALKQRAAAPALATALHTETEPGAQVALLNAFAEVASREGAAIVTPLLDAKSADVRITALKTLLTLDPQQAGPHLSAAMKDPDRAVRRRASLLALGLAGDAALALGEQALGDADAEVRSLGALVLGAGAEERARELLLSALRDPEKKVRKAAAQSLSRILGEDVSTVVELDEPQRRREVRRLATLPSRPVRAVAGAVEEPRVESTPVQAAQPVRTAVGPKDAPRVMKGRSVEAPAVRTVARAAEPPRAETRPVETAPVRAVATEAAVTAPHPGPLPEGEGVTAERLCASLLNELRISIRGRTVAELTSISGEPQGAVKEACELMVARGQAVRRGTKFFAA